MTKAPIGLLDAVCFPVEPATCNAVVPHQQLQMNTVFEIVRAHGLRTT